VSYLHLTVGVSADTGITTTDREYRDGSGAHRIVNLDIGPVNLMLASETEAETKAILDQLLDAVQTLHAASASRLAPSLHKAVALAGSNIPAHTPGAYPNLSCCGGPFRLVAQP
jgi:hypothetical protein